MSSVYGPKAIGTTAPTIINVPNQGVSAVIINNESPYTLKVGIDGTPTMRWVNAFTADIVPVQQGYNGNIIMTAIQVLSNTTLAPSFSVLVEALGQNEIPGSGYPLSLSRVNNIGNTLPVSTQTSSVINDGNAAGNTVVEATQLNATGSNVLITNDGNAQFRDGTTTLTNLLHLIAGAGTAIILGATTRDTQVLGNLLFNGKLGISAPGDTLDAATTPTQLNIGNSGGDFVFLVSGTEQERFTNAGNLRLKGGKLGVTADGDVIDAASATAVYLKCRNSGNLNFQNPNGSTVVTITASSLVLQSGVNITWKTGDTISGTHTFTGAASGTYTHGAGGTPFIVIPMCDVNGSQTMGYDSVTATQVHITSGGGLGFKALTILG